MKRFGMVAFGAMVLAGAVFASAPARADVGIGFSFGDNDGSFDDPCDYYDYYDVAPPWGLPPDYCGYSVYDEPVYWGGYWYRGPIYYRWYGGERLFWLNGGWRRNEWRGARPSVRWTDRGGWQGRPGWGGDRDRAWGGWSGGYRQGGGNRVSSGGDRGWNARGGTRGWNGGGGNQWNGNGGNWSGGGNTGFQGGSRGGFGGGHGGSFGGGHGGGGPRGGGHH